jgi:nicotinic acid mononucleotide adenylyltransferase
MIQLDFWTPISNHTNNLTYIADELFYFGGWQAQLIDSLDNEVRVIDRGESYLKIAGKVALLFTLIVPLFFLFVKIYDRCTNTYQFSKSQDKKTIAEDIEPETKPLKERIVVVLYMSLTGNPTHLGHMAAIATAINELMKKGLKIDHIRVSLSDEGYHKHKVVRNNEKITEAKDKKVTLSQEDREYFLKEAIQEAACRNMFKGVPVWYWNDQDKGYSDHPESYNRLVKELKMPVFLIAGEDLRIGMRDWPSVENVVIVSRELSESSISKYKDNPPSSSYQRIFVKSLYPEFETFSSSAIQKGDKAKARLEPEKLQARFEQIKAAAIQEEVLIFS